MFENIKILWYGWMAIGFGIGLYFHCAIARHAIHWILINILRGFIWLLQQTDHYYKAPKPQETKPIIAQKQAPNNPEKQLADLLSNPDISIRKIHNSL